jgi:hypothetical protein
MRTTYRAGAILLLALALAGCAQAGGGGNQGQGGFGSISTGPSTSASASPADTSTGYPSDAGAYSRAAVTAWLAGDQARLDQLRDPANQLFHSISLGDYDKHYTFQSCQGAAGSSYCLFYNAVGDELTLQLSNQLLGSPHAIVTGTFNPLTFPTDFQAYAQECLDAWKSGNTVRVGFLTTASAKTHLYAIDASHRQDDWTFVDAQGAAGSSYLTWHTPGGDRIVFRFTNPGVDPNQGPQHKIVDVLWNP